MSVLSLPYHMKLVMDPFSDILPSSSCHCAAKETGQTTRVARAVLAGRVTVGTARHWLDSVTCLNFGRFDSCSSSAGGSDSGPGPAPCRFRCIKDAIIHVLPMPSKSTLRSNVPISVITLTHSISQYTTTRLGIGGRERQAEFTTIRIPVELATWINKIVIVFNLDRVILASFLLERVPR